MSVENTILVEEGVAVQVRVGKPMVTEGPIQLPVPLTSEQRSLGTLVVDLGNHFVTEQKLMRAGLIEMPSATSTGLSPAKVGSPVYLFEIGPVRKRDKSGPVTERQVPDFKITVTPKPPIR